MSFTLADSPTNSHPGELETQFQSSEGNKSVDTGGLKKKMSAVWNQGLRNRSKEREIQQRTYG